MPIRIKTVLTRALQQEKAGALTVEEITGYCKRKKMRKPFIALIYFTLLHKTIIFYTDRWPSKW